MKIAPEYEETFKAGPLRHSQVSTTLQKGGLGDTANSWVGSGQNKPVSPGQLGPALGPDIIKTLAQRSGLSEEEITKQLSQALPGIVDRLTPQGRLPTLAELSDLT